jgi:hypothetical protein
MKNLVMPQYFPVPFSREFRYFILRSFPMNPVPAADELLETKNTLRRQLLVPAAVIMRDLSADPLAGMSHCGADPVDGLL